MTKELSDLELAKRLGAATRVHVQKTVDDATEPLLQRILALEQQAKGFKEKVEALPLPTLADVHRGPWRADATYDRGALVAHHGSCWLCRERNAGAEPGKSREWTMFAQRAR